MKLHSKGSSASLRIDFEKFLINFYSSFRTKSDLSSLSFKNRFSLFHRCYPHLPFSFPDRHQALSKFNWGNIGNQNSFFEYLSQQLPHYFFRQSDWKILLDIPLLREYHAEQLFHSGSVQQIFRNNFPQFLWENWKYSVRFSWERKRNFLDSALLGHFSEVRALEDLQGITAHRLAAQVPLGAYLLSLHQGSPVGVFRESYPEWAPREAYGAGMDFCQRRMLVDRVVAEAEGVCSVVSLGEIKAAWFHASPGGTSMLAVALGSPQGVFQHAYPEFTSLPLKKTSQGYWNRLHSNPLLQTAIHTFNIKTKEDWYKISIRHIVQLYGKYVSKANLIKLLVYWVPEEHWEYHKFSEKMNKKSRQSLLGTALERMFSEEVIFEDYKFKAEDRNFIFDYYIPGMNLVVEYQGEQHYFSMLSWWLSLEGQLQNDKEKREFCDQQGLRLVCVPYWWDSQLESLRSLLQKT